MPLAAGEIPDEPAIDCAEGQFTLIGACACTFHVLKNPCNLCAGEIRINEQASLLADHIFSVVVGKLFAKRCTAAVLPDDGVVHRLTGLSIPDDGGLALICDADGDDIARTDAGLSKHLDSSSKLRSKDVEGVVLDPADTRINLLEFMLGYANDVAVVSEENRAGTGGSLVESQNVLHSLMDAMAGITKLTIG